MSENTQGLLEKIARAIHFRGDDQGDDAWNHCQPWLREVAREQARAALTAMREPTEDQLRAAWDAVDYNIDDFWRAMVDAALEPRP